MAEPLSYLSPSCAIVIAGVEIRDELARLIQIVEYESADGIADVAKVTLTNPDGALTDHKLFQPGNEMAIWMGYDRQLTRIGIVELLVPEYDFPESGEPTIQLVGYTRDHAMMLNSPDRSKTDATLPDTAAGRKAQKIGKIRIWGTPAPSGEVPKPGQAPRFGPEKGDKPPRFMEILEEKAKIYGFHLDVGEQVKKRVCSQAIIQPSSMSDYELIKGMCNFENFVFWVDANSTVNAAQPDIVDLVHGMWTMHVFHPTEVQSLYVDSAIVLKYRMGNDSTILKFTPRMALREERTRIKCVTPNPKGGPALEVEFECKLNEAPDAVANDADLEATIEKAYLGGGPVKLYFGDHSIDVLSGKKFRTIAELQKWAEAWFRKQRNNFIAGDISTIGVPTLMARQEHFLQGLSTGLDGAYYFPRVKHVMDNKTGYRLDITAHKIIENFKGTAPDGAILDAPDTSVSPDLIGVGGGVG